MASDLCKILRQADGVPQPWNEVYYYPQQVSEPLSQRFALLRDIEKRALDSGSFVGGQGLHECGLDKATLDSYVAAVGLDVDVGVGSLVLVLNSCPGIQTLSSCSAAHAGAHEEEALVAFTAESKEALKLVSDCLGSDHCKSSQEAVVKTKKDRSGKPSSSGTALETYIAFSDARGADGKPDYSGRVADLGKLAECIYQKILHGSCDASETHEPDKQKKRKVSGLGSKKCPKALGAAQKRVKVDSGLQMAELQKSVSDLRGQFLLSSCVAIPSLCQVEAMNATRDELVQQLQGLLPVESPTLMGLLRAVGNLGAEERQLPRLVSLCRDLCSQSFRAVLEKITDCGPLSEKVDLSILAIPQGGYWLNHPSTEGNVHRALAFSVFFTEDWWDAKMHGGFSEVWKVDAAKPNVLVPPVFNSLLVYSPSAQIAVQEVFTDKAPRLALLGFYYSARACQHGQSQESPLESSTSQQLGADEEPRAGYGSADRTELGRLVNESYLSEEFLSKAQSKFIKDSHSKFSNFLTSAGEFLDACRQRDQQDGVADGITTPGSLEAFVEKGWRLVGPASQYRCLHFTTPSTDGCSCSVGKSLERLATLFSSASFLRYLESVTGLRILGTAPVAVEIRRFRPGGDYAQPQGTNGPRLDATLCLVSDNEDEMWAVCGGAETYYDPNCGPRENRDPLLKTKAVGNMLSLVLREPGIQRCIEAVRQFSPGSRWDIWASYVVEQLEEDSEGGESEELVDPSESDDD